MEAQTISWKIVQENMENLVILKAVGEDQMRLQRFMTDAEIEFF